MHMDWSLELLFVARTIGATILGGLIGWDREVKGRDAGIRTYSAVALGACTFGQISSHVGAGDPAYIAAQVVSGIGFLCAGVILRQDGKVQGLTTAATIWATASVGLAMAFGLYILSTLTALIIVAVLAAQRATSAIGNGPTGGTG